MAMLFLDFDRYDYLANGVTPLLSPELRKRRGPIRNRALTLEEARNNLAALDDGRKR
jgi:hypothetical protein